MHLSIKNKIHFSPVTSCMHNEEHSKSLAPRKVNDSLSDSVEKVFHENAALGTPNIHLQ